VGKDLDTTTVAELCCQRRDSAHEKELVECPKEKESEVGIASNEHRIQVTIVPG
jgi:hypothetical protein